MSIEQFKRRRRLSTFCLATEDSLSEGLGQIASRPEYNFLRRPESGLIMVRGRIGNNGQAFNLGEMLVTRCTIQYQGRLGHGWAQGLGALKAELTALADALGQIPEYEEAIDRLAEKLESEKGLRDAGRQAEINNTRVHFFTMVRGEDKNG